MPETIEPFLEAFADCGPLRLQNAPPLGYGLNDPITVTGRFGSEAQRDMLQTELGVLGGARPVVMQSDMLNPALCRVDAALPFARPGNFEVTFGWGDRPGENTQGVFAVGENPTIDVILPPDVTTGFVHVSIVDVNGNVFHLLPNNFRPDNSVEFLRTIADESGAVRVAFPKEGGNRTTRPWFAVDDTTLGASRVMVVYAPEQPLKDLRPITESVASYAEALEAARAAGTLNVQSLDAAILTTVAAN